MNRSNKIFLYSEHRSIIISQKEKLSETKNTNFVCFMFLLFKYLTSYHFVKVSVGAISRRDFRRGSTLWPVLFKGIYQKEFY